MSMFLYGRLSPEVSSDEVETKAVIPYPEFDPEHREYTHTLRGESFDFLSANEDTELVYVQFGTLTPEIRWRMLEEGMISLQEDGHFPSSSSAAMEDCIAKHGKTVARWLGYTRVPAAVDLFYVA